MKSLNWLPFGLNYCCKYKQGQRRTEDSQRLESLAVSGALAAARTPGRNYTSPRQALLRPDNQLVLLPCLEPTHPVYFPHFPVLQGTQAHYSWHRIWTAMCMQGALPLLMATSTVYTSTSTVYFHFYCLLLLSSFTSTVYFHFLYLLPVSNIYIRLLMSTSTSYIYILCLLFTSIFKCLITRFISISYI